MKLLPAVSWIIESARVKIRRFDLRRILSAPREQTEPNMWSSFRAIVLVALLAVTVTAVDIFFSGQIGLLSHPPTYDGVSYVVNAKSLFYQVRQFRFDLSHVHASLGLLNVLISRFLLSYASLWHALMVLSFLLLGEGEWQAYTVRFWPIFLLLLLVLWVVRRRGRRNVVLAAVTFTSLLPTISVGLRASVWEHFAGIVVYLIGRDVGLEWYLADLRPDLLFSVLLLWTVVPLIESVRKLGRRVWLISGACAGLAVLVKSSMSPLLFFAGAVTVLYVLIVNRRRIRLTVLTSLWGLLPFAILVVPWIRIGGADLAFQYLYMALTAQRAVYSDPNATLLSEAFYYWKFFPLHMGNVEAWVILGIGLAVSMLSLRRRTERKDSRIIGYLGVSTTLYICSSAVPNKNYFAGLPYYLLLWVFSWTAIASLTKIRPRRDRIVPLLLMLILCIYAGSCVFAGFYSLQNWPADRRLAAQQNRQIVQEIAKDLRSFLTNNDLFMWAPCYGFPGSLQYYAMDKEGGYPKWVWIDFGKSPEKVIQESVSTCKVIFAYEEDIDEVAKIMYFHPLARPYFRAIAEWVKQPNSSYTPVKTYCFVTQTNRLTLHLYLKQSNAREELKTGDVNLPLALATIQTIGVTAPKPYLSGRLSGLGLRTCIDNSFFARIKGESR